MIEDRLIENKAYRVILLGVIEIIGKNGLKSILNYSGLIKYADAIPENSNEKTGPKISEVTALSEGIEEIYGRNGARAILSQVGRMQAKWGVKENSDIARKALAAMESMSERDRARVVLNYTAATISKQLNTETWIEEEGEFFFYKDKAATHCFNRKSDRPVCHMTEGFVNGMVAWGSGSSEWKVEETECMSMGRPQCTYRIYKAEVDPAQDLEHG